MEILNRVFKKIDRQLFWYYLKIVKSAKNINISDLEAIRQYHTWIDNIEKEYLKTERRRKEKIIKSFKITPKISLLIPTYNTDPRILEKTINSVYKQWYQNWELCLYDDASTNQETKKFLKKIRETNDKCVKIKFGKKNLNIALATNEAFKLSTGEYVMLMDHDDELREFSLYEIVKKINEMNGDVDLIYFDDDRLDGKLRHNPYFKPDFSYDMLYSIMIYIHAVYSRRIFKKAGKMRAGYEGSQDYDLCLRVVEKTNKIAHISKILYHWRMVEGSTSVDIGNKSYALLNAVKAVNDAIKRRGLDGQVTNDYYPLISELKYKSDEVIDIVIDARGQNAEGINKTLQSIDTQINYTKINLNLLVNNNEISQDLRFKGHIIRNKNIKEVFDTINSKYILYLKVPLIFIDNDILKRSLGWIEQDEIGIVSFKVLFSDGSINNAGNILSKNGIPLRVHYKQMDRLPVYFYNALFIRNYLILGDEIILFKRSLLDDLKFDLKKLWYVDLSIHSFENGYRNLFLPNIMCQSDRKFEINNLDKNEIKTVLRKYKKFVEYDPFANPNLSRDNQKKLLEIRM